MNWGVNARRLAGQRLGVGRYIEYLLKHWDRMLDPADTVSLFVRAPFDKDTLGLSNRYRVHLLKPELTGILWENAHLPRYASGVDVLFCPAYTAPLAYRGRLVVATHSVDEVARGANPWWFYLTYAPIYRWSARLAQRVIVPAEVTKRDVEAHFGIPGEKIDVVPQGADDSFRPLEDPDLLKATRIKYLGEDVPYLLFVGKLSVRRNIPTLLRAFAALKKKKRIPHKLLLVGPNHVNLPLREIITELGVTDSVVQTDGRFANHRELVPIYNAADMYVNPSSYEGFSITTVEAFSCGIPVVATDRAGLHEIASGYARMVDEPTPEKVADAIEEVLADQDLRQRLRALSLERARAFRWEDTARETLKVLQRVASA